MSANYYDSTTLLLSQWKNGQPRAMDRLIERVYDELRQIAQRQLRGERSGHILQTTALVHEAYERLVELRHIDWRDRRHFFTVATGIMRRVLVDQARSNKALKRGGDALRVTLDENLSSSPRRGRYSGRGQRP